MFEREGVGVGEVGGDEEVEFWGEVEEVGWWCSVNTRGEGDGVGGV